MELANQTERPNKEGGGGPPRLARTKLPSFFTVIVILVTLLGAGNFCLAAFGFIQERDGNGYIKIALISIAAFVVAFAANKFATEEGAPQAAKGYWSSGAISLAALIMVGLSLFAATYAGQTIKPAQALRDAAHGPVLQRYAAARIRASRTGSAADTGIRNALDVLIKKRDCELRIGCISLRQAGAGPVTRALEPLIDRAKQVIDSRGAQTSDRQKIADQVNRLLERYRLVASQTSQDVYERRRILEGLHGKIEQRLNELDTVEPISVAKAYAAELRRGASIEGRPGAVARLNSILSGLADTITDALDGNGYKAKLMPDFPGRVGVSDTFSYIGKFLPVAGVIFTIEALLPLLLWTFAFNKARWEIYLAEQRAAELHEREAPDAASASPSEPPGTKSNGHDRSAPDVSGDPIDGPHGWSGRSRFNDRELGKKDGGEA
jgi:hypothetical protein